MKIVVNEDEDGNGTTVFVDTENRMNFRTEQQYEGVTIVTAHGISHMTYKQWKSMLAIGISMLMQEENPHGKLCSCETCVWPERKEQTNV